MSGHQGNQRPAPTPAAFCGWWRPLIPRPGRWEQVCTGASHGEALDNLLSTLAATKRKNGEALVLPHDRTPWEGRRIR